MCSPTTGNVGIGTFTPSNKLDVVNGFSHFTFNTRTIPASDQFNGGLTIGWNRMGGTTGGDAEVDIYNIFPNNDPINTPTTAFQFSQTTGTGTVNDLMTIKSNGCVGIGTNLTDATYDNTYKLAVHGKIRALALKVEPGWADYVFQKNYSLLSVKELETYIKKYGHLPEIPTTEEINKDGADVGELLKLQMQKIEELTLYIIEQNKRIEALEKNR